MKRYRNHILVGCLFVVALFAATWTSSLLHQPNAKADCAGDFCWGDDGSVQGGGCTPTANAKKWASTCYGGFWQQYPVTSDSIQIKGNTGGEISGGYVTGCQGIEAPTFYRLALVYFNTTTGEEMEQVGLLPVNKFKGYGGITVFRGGCSTELGSSRPCMETAREMFDIYKARANATSANFTTSSWFCWSDKWIQEYESNSSASYNGTNVVSSQWVNEATDKTLTIDAKAGDTVDIQFFQLIRATSDTQDSTDWQIIRFNYNNSNHSGVTYQDLTHGGDQVSYFAGTLNDSTRTGTLATSDTQSHAIIGSSGSNSHTIRVTLPANDPSDYSIKFCEQILYQSNSKVSIKDKWSFVCVQINVTAAATYESNSSASYGGDTVSSNWVNRATDQVLTIDAKAGDVLDIQFSQLIRATADTQASTQWEIIRFNYNNSNHTGVSYQDITYGGSPSSSFWGSLVQSVGSGTLATTNTQSHPVPSSSSNNSHTIRVSLPANDPSSYTIKFCEQLNYQSSSSSSSKDRWSYVCVQINVTSDLVISTGNDCPLSYFSAPDPGDKDSGTTDTESGVVSNVFTSYSKFIYVKPSDLVSWAHCYNPEAQAVRYTDESDDHPTPSADGPESSAETYVGPQDGIVSSRNEATIYTTNSNSFAQNVSFTVSPASPFSVSGNTISGDTGDSSSAVIYSATAQPYYIINSGYAGTTSTQSIYTDIGTNSVTPHTEWDWTYIYTCKGCCREPVEQTICVDIDPAEDSENTSGTSSTGTARVSDDFCGEGQQAQTTTVDKPADCPREGTGTGTHTGNPYYSIASQTSWGKSSEASFYIPYNFTTAVSTNISQTHSTSAREEIVLAGERITINAAVVIKPRDNRTTDGWYATEPPADTKVEIVTFYLEPNASIPSGSSAASVSSVCGFYNSRVQQCNTVKTYSNRNAWMNSQPALTEDSTYSFSHSITTYNVPAGYLVCSAVGISHTDSGNDTNNNGAGVVNNKWNISTPTCRTVAKKPNLQIWGGSLISNGQVKTSSATKSSPSSRTFGSWTEFAAIAASTTGSISGLGSGASLGYTTSYYSNSNNGGNANSYFYLRTPLAIANSNCINNTSCTTVTASGITSNSTIMHRLITRLIEKVNATSYARGSAINLSSINTQSGGYRITRTDQDIIIYANADLPAGTTQIVYTTGSITISGNLTYDKTNNGNSYATIQDIPQYIIIADGNINISPDVTEIDAWLIAENGTIDTCSALNETIGGALNSSTTSCGKQLVINGPIIAKSISPKRAYGAGAQDSSGTSAVGYLTFNDQYGVEPAEIFNLPLYSYLWAYAQAYRTTEPHTVYTRVLAPRL